MCLSFFVGENLRKSGVLSILGYVFYIVKFVMSDSLIVALEKWGMTTFEAKIYLTALELGSSPASAIARRAGIKRVTGYAILRDFITKGIASKVEKSGVSYFQVVNPQKLLHTLESRVTAFEKYVPQLLAMADIYGNKPKIEYFEGVELMKTMYEDMAMSESDICAFLTTDVVHSDLREYLETVHVSQRVANGVCAKVIVNDTDSNHSYQEADDENLRETLVVSESIAHFANEIDVYGPNKVALSMYS